MSNAATKKMIRPYIQMAPVAMFLTSFFQARPENYHTSEEVEIDVVRTDEDVAIVITDLSTGARQNLEDLFTNKKMKPPIFDEEISINSFDLIKREAGQNPFEDPNYAANLLRRMFRGMQKVDAKIRRAIELMAAQVLQTGTLTLQDGTGAAKYVLDFKPKATHFPTVTNSWGTANADPLEDCAALAEVIRSDGLSNPDILLMGRNAIAHFLNDDKVQKQLDNRGFNIGAINPEQRPGGTYYGHIWIGSYKFELWTYNGRYRDSATGESVPYLNDDAVVMLSSQERMDLTFGEIPRIVSPDSRLLPFIPGRFADSATRTDLSTFAWITPDGKQVKGSAGTRPLTIPTAIDTYGCLTTSVS